jgi:methylenetetrahydrofolate dehydrogenase (NADP+)/methenyltetrahydrofolate cyclohydrolase/formyltetrahydrofolate synthetase
LHFSSDTPAELSLVREEALAGGADAAIVSNHWAEGGAGARALAEAVVATCEGPSGFKFLYDLELPIEEKISTISKEIYGADGIELSELARKQVDTYTRQGYGNLPSECGYIILYLTLIGLSSLHGKDAVFILTRS